MKTPARNFVIAFALSLALFAFTAHRHVGLPDWAVMASAFSRPELSVAAWNHPLTNLCGWLATRFSDPVDFPSRMVWVSIIPMALSIAFFVAALAKKGAPFFLALTCRMVHAVGHSVWWHGTVAENYAISALFLSASIYFGLSNQRQGNTASAIALFAIAGLSLANHVENAVLTLGAVAWLVAICVTSLRTDRKKAIMSSAVVAWIVGASLFFILLVRDATLHHGVFASMSGGGFRQQMMQLDPSLAARRFFDLWTLEYPSPFFVVAFAGLVIALLPFISLRHAPSPFRWQCLAIVLPVMAFALTYDAWDRFAFFLPVFTIADFQASNLIARWWNFAGDRRQLRVAIAALCLLSLALPSFAYASISRWVGEGNGYWARRFGGIARQYEHRADMVGMLVNPISHDGGSIERHARAILDAMPNGTIIIDDMAFQYQLEWMASMHDNANLKVVSVVPGFLDGHGVDPKTAASLAALNDGAAFLTTTNGLCGAVVESLRPYRRKVEALPIGDGGEIFRIVPLN